MVNATLSDGIVDHDDDPYIPAEQAADHYPVPCHRATGWRHMSRGVLRGDVRIRLKSIVIGGRRYVRASWIAEFISALNADNPTQQPAAGAARVRRQRQAAAAMAVLTSAK